MSGFAAAYTARIIRGAKSTPEGIPRWQVTVRKGDRVIAHCYGDTVREVAEEVVLVIERDQMPRLQIEKILPAS